jgi:hypothetical protein
MAFPTSLNDLSSQVIPLKPHLLGGRQHILEIAAAAVVVASKRNVMSVISSDGK